jgi:hypothetical protein
MSSLIAALLLGAGFGFALNKGGLTKYHKIVGVFRFTDLTVIKFMLSAVVTAMIGLFALRGLGLIELPAPPATYIAGNLIGGLVFGIGMALTGY